MLLFSSGRAEAAAVHIGKRFALLKLNGGLNLEDPELADAVALFELRVARSVDRELPLVVRAAIAVVDDADGVCLKQAPTLEGRRSGRGSGLVPFRQLHRNAQRHEREVSGLQCHILRAVKVDPVADFRRLESRKIIGKIVDFDFRHGVSPNITAPRPRE